MNELITINTVKEMAEAACKSRLFQIPTPEAALTLMLLCQSEGLHPIAALKRYHIIQGRPAMRADAMLADYLRQGGKVEWQERSDKRVAAVFSTEQSGSCLFEWTIKQADEAGLTGSQTWKKYPRQMLTARVISEAVRTMMPGVVCGVYTPEEIQDFDTPAPVAPVTPVTAEKSTATTAEKSTATTATPKVETVEDAEIIKPGPEKTGKQVADELKAIRELAVKAGCKNPKEIKTLYESLIGRELSSANDLSDGERNKIMEALRSNESTGNSR